VGFNMADYGGCSLGPRARSLIRGSGVVARVTSNLAFWGETLNRRSPLGRNILSGIRDISVCCLLIPPLAAVCFAQDHAAKGLSEDDILRALRRGVLSSVIESSVRKTGIGFVIDEEVEAELRKAGASEGLISEIKELAPAPVTPPRQPPAPTPVQEPSPPSESQPISPAAPEDVVPSTDSHSASHSISKEHRGSQPSASQTPVLVICDADCKLRIDGAPAGSLNEKKSKLLKLVQGDHLIEASALASNVTWRKTLTLTGADQIIVNTELQPLLLKDLLSIYRGTWRATFSHDCGSRVEFGPGSTPNICSRTCSYTYELTLSYDPDHILRSTFTDHQHLSASSCDRFPLDNRPESDSQSDATGHGGVVESVTSSEIVLWVGDNRITLRKVGDKLETNFGTDSLTFDRVDGS
jgi:hypothetical protein